MNRDASPPEQGHRRLTRAVLVAAFIACAAPLIGGAMILAIATASGFLSELMLGRWDAGFAELAASVGGPARYAGLAVAYSYLLGGAQALLSAAWLGARVYRTGTFGDGEAQLAALAANAIVAVAVMILAPVDRGGASLLVLALVLVSMVSAFISRWLLLRLGILSP